MKSEQFNKFGFNINFEIKFVKFFIFGSFVSFRSNSWNLENRLALEINRQPSFDEFSLKKIVKSEQFNKFGFNVNFETKFVKLFVFGCFVSFRTDSWNLEHNTNYNTYVSKFKICIVKTMDFDTKDVLTVR